MQTGIGPTPGRTARTVMPPAITLFFTPRDIDRACNLITQALRLTKKKRERERERDPRVLATKNAQSTSLMKSEFSERSTE